MTKRMEGWRNLCMLLFLFTLAVFSTSHAQAQKDPSSIRIMTYNIHHGVGVDGRLDLEAIADVVEEKGVDVVAFQEVDRYWSARSDFIDQAEWLADRLEMNSFFTPIYDLPAQSRGAAQSNRRQYGLAILSEFPIAGRQNFKITRLSTVSDDAEPKMMTGFPLATLNVNGTRLHVFNTHLDFRADPSVRKQQVADMLKEMAAVKGPKVLLGDFNAAPSADELSPLTEHFIDAWSTTENGDGYTYPSNAPSKRLDHIWVTPEIDVRSIEVVKTQASDHLPVIAEVVLPRQAAGHESTGSAWVEQTLDALTLKEKVGQLFIAWSGGHYQSVDAPWYRRMVRFVEDFKIGGVIFGVGAPLAQAALTNDLQQQASLPLLIVQDMEWGPGMRLDHTVSFPRAMAIGATRNPSLAQAAGYATGSAARALGVHQVYGPVADVNNNPANPVINVRSFGERPELVAEMTAAFVRGVQQAGALATAKHFPGHGDTATDSHIGLPVLDISRARLDTLELVPFRAAIAAGTRSIMTGHLALPRIEPDSTVPATLSPAVTKAILREDLGYDGLIVTDAMTMGALGRYFSVGEAAVRAIEAGADMLLKSENFYAARRAILDAIASGRLTEARIDRSVRRILQAKEWVGLNHDRLVDLEAVRKHVGTRAPRLLTGKIAREALTLLRNRNEILPITPPASPHILAVTLSDSYDPSVGGTFNSHLRRSAHTEVDFARLDVRSRASDFEAVLEDAASYDVVLVPAFLRVRSGSGRIRLPQAHRDFLNNLIEGNTSVVLIALGNPYMASDLRQQPDAYLTTYGAGDAAQEAAAQMIFGKSSAHGKLPVTIPGAYAFGAGLLLDQQAPRMDYPEAAGLDTRQLNEVDSLMHASISNEAFPGAAVAIGRGKILAKLTGFGYHTYDAEQPTTPSSVFDLASLTKVVATTTAAMLLYEEGLLDLDAPVADYLPAFAENGKGEVTVRQLLSHSSGLKAYLHPATYHFSSREELVDAVLAQELQYEPGDKSVYSGLGMITLQLIIEKITGQNLAIYAEEHIFEPLGMDDTGFDPTTSAVPTSNGDEVYRGVVHDPMARVMEGVSGQAGLFSTADDLAIFAYMLVNEGRIYGRQFLQKETIELFTERAGIGSTRALGWDTKTMNGYSSAGHFFGPESFGHTGYTGTSFWVDPEQDLFAILLTNRVYPEGGANQRHRAVRAKFADIVFKSITSETPVQKTSSQ